ncbi:MAG: type II secretion system GspH family protein [Holosporales bacterium]|nr:type II secretion system GspH family protein [Holosporales bacterium]
MARQIAKPCHTNNNGHSGGGHGRCQMSLSGFSLIEISMVLLVIGIIAGGVLKGRDLIEAAQLRSVASDFHSIQVAYLNYINSHGALPGDDSGASAKFGSEVSNGDGNGETSSSDAKSIFAHLYAAGLIEAKDFKVPKIGGSYSVISENNQPKMLLDNHGKALLNGKQLAVLLAKMKELLGDEFNQVETDPATISSDRSAKYKVKMRLGLA